MWKCSISVCFIHIWNNMWNFWKGKHTYPIQALLLSLSGSVNSLAKTSHLSIRLIETVKFAGKIHDLQGSEVASEKVWNVKSDDMKRELRNQMKINLPPELWILRVKIEHFSMIYLIHMWIGRVQNFTYKV